MPAFVFFFILFLSLSAQASEQNYFFEWQANNIQLLYGDGFKLSDNAQATITYEHVDGWKYGDNFLYIDYVIGEPDEVNAEFSPRLSLSKISGLNLSYGIIQDVLISGTWEKTPGFEAYLYGGAVDLNLPGFNFFQINLYERNNPEADGKGWQTTWVWSLPFEVMETKWSFDGYFDYANYEEGEKNFFTQPQLLFDIGDLTGYEEGKFYVGAEYRYWNNKFGIDGVTESVPQAMIKVAL